MKFTQQQTDFLKAIFGTLFIAQGEEFSVNPEIYDRFFYVEGKNVVFNVEELVQVADAVKGSNTLVAQEGEVRCEEMTKKSEYKERCTLKAVEGEKMCRVHLKSKNAVKVEKEPTEKAPCQAITKLKKPCSYSAKKGSNYCGRHSEYNGDVAVPEAKEAKVKVMCTAPVGKRTCLKAANKNGVYCTAHEKKYAAVPEAEKLVEQHLEAVW